MLLFDMTSFCSETAGLLQFIGYVVTVVKVAIPILIIIFGILDLGKAVVGSNDDQIKKSAKSLMWRALAGVFIFFIPSIITWLFSAIADYNAETQSGQFDICETCILHPGDCPVK